MFLACEQIDLDEPTASAGPSSPPRDAAGSSRGSESSEVHELAAVVSNSALTAVEFGCASVDPADSDVVVTFVDISGISALTGEDTDGVAGSPKTLTAAVELSKFSLPSKERGYHT